MNYVIRVVIGIHAGRRVHDYAGVSVARKHAAAHKAHGAVDILVTNVGGAIWMKPFQHFDEKQIVAEVQRSLFPTLWGCRAALPYMLDQGRGAIVNVSSVVTKGVNRAPYSAAKGAVNALTASLGFELGTKNIRVNAVAPGGTTRRRASAIAAQGEGPTGR